MRSLGSGFDEMCSLIEDFQFDVFGITETWVSLDIPSEYYEVPGYTFIRSDRRTNVENNKGGGGVALYLRDNIHFVQHFAENIDEGIEHITVVIRSKGLRFGICIVYRPPGVKYTNLDSLFHSMFVDLAAEVDKVIMMGDTNINLMSKNCPEVKFLRKLMQTTNTQQLITEPTRVTSHTSTLIDHIFVDKSTHLQTGVIDASKLKDHRNVSITDHKLIYVQVNCRKDKKLSKMVKYRDYSKFEISGVLN